MTVGRLTADSRTPAVLKRRDLAGSAHGIASIDVVEAVLRAIRCCLCRDTTFDARLPRVDGLAFGTRRKSAGFSSAAGGLAPWCRTRKNWSPAAQRTWSLRHTAEWGNLTAPSERTLSARSFCVSLRKRNCRNRSVPNRRQGLSTFPSCSSSRQCFRGTWRAEGASLATAWATNSSRARARAGPEKHGIVQGAQSWGPSGTGKASSVGWTPRWSRHVVISVICSAKCPMSCRGQRANAGGSRNSQQHAHFRPVTPAASDCLRLLRGLTSSAMAARRAQLQSVTRSAAAWSAGDRLPARKQHVVTLLRRAPTMQRVP